MIKDIVENLPVETFNTKLKEALAEEVWEEIQEFMDKEMENCIYDVVKDYVSEESWEEIHGRIHAYVTSQIEAFLEEKWEFFIFEESHTIIINMKFEILNYSGVENLFDNELKSFSEMQRKSFLPEESLKIIIEKLNGFSTKERQESLSMKLKRVLAEAETTLGEKMKKIEGLFAEEMKEFLEIELGRFSTSEKEKYISEESRKVIIEEVLFLLTDDQQKSLMRNEIQKNLDKRLRSCLIERMKEFSSDERRNELGMMMMKKELIERFQPNLIEIFQTFLTQKIKEKLGKTIVKITPFKEIENFILEKVREFLTNEVEGNLGKMEIDRALADELEKEIIARGEQFLSLKIADFLNKNLINPSFEELKEKIFEKIQNLLDIEGVKTGFMAEMKEFVIDKKCSSETEQAQSPKEEKKVRILKLEGKEENFSGVRKIDTADEMRNILIDKISKYLDKNLEKFSSGDLAKNTYRKIREFLSEERRISHMQRKECLIEKLLDFLTIKMEEFIFEEARIASAYQMQEMNCSSFEGREKAFHEKGQEILVDKIRRNLIDKRVNKPIDQYKYEFNNDDQRKYKHNLRFKYEFEHDMKLDESLNEVLREHIIMNMKYILTGEIKKYLFWKMEKLPSEVCIKRGKPDILKCLNWIDKDGLKYNGECTNIITSMFIKRCWEINLPDIKIADLEALNEEKWKLLSAKREIWEAEQINVASIKDKISGIFDNKCGRSISNLYSLKENVDFSQCNALNIAYLLTFLDDACYFVQYSSILFRFIARGAYREEIESLSGIDLWDNEKNMDLLWPLDLFTILILS